MRTQYTYGRDSAIAQAIMPSSETGFDYFGASPDSCAGYDSELSVWLSVDPLSDKYPSMSPYMYTAGNPVKLVDPDGKDIWISNCLQGQPGGDLILYTPGMSVPSGMENTFIGQTIIGLNYLNQNAQGSTADVYNWYAFQGGDNHEFTIRPLPFKANGSADFEVDYDAFTGVIYNQENPETGETKSPPVSTLFHEMVHKYFADNGDVLYDLLQMDVRNGTVSPNSKEYQQRENQANNWWELTHNEDAVIQYQNMYNCDSGWGLRVGNENGSAHRVSTVGEYLPENSVSIDLAH